MALLRHWHLVVIVLIIAVVVVIAGIWGSVWFAGDADPFANAVRTLEWETLTAGLLGLAGGLCVIVATRRQMAQAESIAAQHRRDFLLSDLNSKFSETDLCYAGFQEFIDEIEKIKAKEGGDVEAGLAKAVVHLIELRNGERPVSAIIDMAKELIDRNKVPSGARDAFQNATHSLVELNNVYDTDESMVPEKAETLRGDVAEFRDALKKHKERILEVRLL